MEQPQTEELKTQAETKVEETLSKPEMKVDAAFFQPTGNKQFDEEYKKLADLLDNLKPDNVDPEVIKTCQDKEDFKTLKKESRLKKIKKDFEKSTEPSRQLNALNKILNYAKELNEETQIFNYHTKNLNDNNSKISQDMESTNQKLTVLENLDKDLEKRLTEQQTIYEGLPNELQGLRKQLADSFQVKLQEIQQRVEEQGKLKMQYAKEQEILLQKLQEVQQQIQTREVLYQTEQKKKEIECQLTDSKFTADLVGIQGQANLLKDLQQQQMKQQEDEKVYEAQVNQYKDVHDQLQEAAMKSNKTFANLKDQITSGNKSIETYEQQMNHLRDKQDKLENEIYNQIQKYSILQGEKVKQSQQLETMKSLLNTLSQTLQQKKDLLQKKLEEEKKQE